MAIDGAPPVVFLDGEGDEDRGDDGDGQHVVEPGAADVGDLENEKEEHLHKIEPKKRRVIRLLELGSIYT